METKKVLSIIFSSLFIVAFIFVTTWGIINFNKVKEGMSGTGVYTEQDINNAYDDGYNTGFKNKEEYDTLINSYRDTITTQTDQISQLNSQVTTLTNRNEDYCNQITTLTSTKEDLQNQVDNLTLIQTSNETTISELNSQVVTLQKEVDTLTNTNEDNSTLIEQKNTQIANLQNTVTQLQKTNELNLETITNLNNQISNLNSQITEMSQQIQNNSTNVSALNNKIAELEKSVSYYEQYIASLENGEQVVATFEFNGSVYNIQIVNVNDIVSVVTPTSTDKVIFNYWTVNGEQVDLSTYPLTTNTKFVADVTYKYEIKFMVEKDTYSSQFVVLDSYIELPENPTIDGYDFDGWTIDGVNVIDPTTIQVTQDTTFIAKLTKLHNVTFMVDNETYNTQLVRNGEFVVLPTEPQGTDGYTFTGWTINGTDNIDLTTTNILSDSIYIAKFEILEIELDGYKLFYNADYSSIIFDYYTSSNEYLVDGVNVIENITPTTLASNDTCSVDKFVVDSTCYVLSRADINLTDCNCLFRGCSSLITLVLNNFNTDNVTNMSYMFCGVGLTSIDLSLLNTQNVTDISYMFNSSKITSIDLSHLDTSNVNNIIGLFSACKQLTSVDLSYLNIGNITDISYLFSGCTSISSIDLSCLNTSNITNISYLFRGCTSLTTIDLTSLDISNVTNMSYLFSGCTALVSADLSNLNTGNVTNMSYLFNGCSSLTSINLNNLYVL